MLHQIGIHLNHHPDGKTQISSLDDEDEEKGIAYLPDVGDFVVIDGVHTGRVTNRTFCYEVEGGGVCFIMINADRVTILQRVRAQAH